MKFKDGLAVKDIKIERFIFHVVHQGTDNPILLNETPLGKHSVFFAERVLETIEGNRFVFNEGSLVLEKLQDIDKDAKQFVRRTKDMAIHFNTFQNDSIKPGVVIIMKVLIDKKPYYSIIKYDHEDVIAYRIDDTATKAILEDVANSFTKNKESLHKSALIELGKDSGEVLVIDKKVREDISKFFKGFLNISRLFSNEELTKKVEKITIEVVKDHRDELPRDFVQNIRKTVFEATQTDDSFTVDSYYEKVFGLVGNDRIRKTLYRQLKKNDLEGEVFKFDKTVLAKPRKRRIRTKEGVRIQYDESAKDRVEFIEEKDIKKIVIKTEQFYDE